MTERWGLVEALGSPELSKLPIPWAVHPLQGLRMCPELTTAACPSGPGHQRSPHPPCGLLAGPSWEAVTRQLTAHTCRASLSLDLYAEAD